MSSVRHTLRESSLVIRIKNGNLFQFDCTRVILIGLRSYLNCSKSVMESDINTIVSGVCSIS